MDRRKFNRRFLKPIGVFLAIMLFVLGLVVDILVGPRFWWLQPAIMLCGIAWGVVVFWASPKIQLRIYFSLGTFLFAILIVEVGFRIVGFDFNQTHKRYAATPIFFRAPTEPLPPIFFRRAGPDEWRGKALTWRMKQIGLQPTAYADEQEIHVKYDAEGFRNPPNLDDWRIAVAGDSFTELGYLPDEHLFTHLLAKKLGVSVKNLGVTDTATLTHLAYLDRMGVSASTRHWVIVFFEGNDPDGLRAELEALETFAETGVRAYRNVRKAAFKPQTSALVAAARIVRETFQPRTKPNGNATLIIGDRRLPVSVTYAPPNEKELPEIQRRALRHAIVEFHKAAARHKVKPWLVYMPCKHRVLRNRLKFSEWVAKRLQHWSPSDLPDYVAGLCRKHGIDFIDPLAALQSETELTFNSVGDTHLNRRGSRIVAEELAKAMAGALQTAPVP